MSFDFATMWKVASRSVVWSYVAGLICGAWWF